MGGEFRDGFFLKEEHPGIAFIAVAEAEDLFASRTALFIDSRSRKEYEAGHIPGAVSVPYDAGKKSPTPADLAVPQDRTLVVYCHGGGCQMSISLAKALSSSGFKDIKIYAGGLAEWESLRLPMEK